MKERSNERTEKQGTEINERADTQNQLSNKQINRPRNNQINSKKQNNPPKNKQTNKQIKTRNQQINKIKRHTGTDKHSNGFTQKSIKKKTKPNNTTNP